MDSKMDALIETSSNVENDESSYIAPTFLRKKVVIGVLVLLLVFSVALACIIAAILHHEGKHKFSSAYLYKRSYSINCTCRQYFTVY